MNYLNGNRSAMQHSLLQKTAHHRQPWMPQGLWLAKPALQSLEKSPACRHPRKQRPL